MLNHGAFTSVLRVPSSHLLFRRRFRLPLIHCLVVWHLFAATAADAQGTIQEATAVTHLRIGGDPNITTPLATVRGLVVLPNRGMLVLDDRNRTASLFDSAGRFVREIARRGQGPGELRGPIAMGLYKDTVWVHEEGFPVDRLVLFRFDGTFISQRADMDSRPVIAGDSRFLRTPIVRGTTGVSIRHFVAGAMSEESPRIGVVRFSPTMIPLDTIASYEASRIYARRGKVFVPTLSNVFSDYPLVAGQPGGTHFLVLDRTVGRSALELVRVATATGLTESRTTFVVPARRLTLAEIDSAVRVAGILGYRRAGPAARRAGTVDDFITSLRQGTAIPQQAPLASALVAGMDGTSWVRLWGPSARWVVFDSTGRPLQRVVLPPDTELLAAERDYVWCLTLDRNDVPWITTFRIVR